MIPSSAVEYDARRAAFRSGSPGPLRDERHRRRRVHRSGPQAGERDDQVKTIDDRPAAILRRKKFQERAVHRPLPAEFLHFIFPARGLLHVVANQADQQRGHAAQREHGSPSVMAADKNIRDARKKKSDVVARVHQRRAHRAPLLGPILGNERGADRPFAADADSRHEAKHREAPDARGKRGQQRE